MSFEDTDPLESFPSIKPELLLDFPETAKDSALTNIGTTSGPSPPLVKKAMQPSQFNIPLSNTHIGGLPLSQIPRSTLPSRPPISPPKNLSSAGNSTITISRILNTSRKSPKKDEEKSLSRRQKFNGKDSGQGQTSSCQLPLSILKRSSANNDMMNYKSRNHADSTSNSPNFDNISISKESKQNSSKKKVSFSPTRTFHLIDSNPNTKDTSKPRKFS